MDLSRLSQIDWSNLSHAYGQATDVPSLLKALADGADQDRSEALHELFGSIYHQGTVYPATVEAIPFLCSILESRGGEDEDVVALLACIAGGNGYLEVHACGDRGRKQWEEILAERGMELDVELEKEAQHVSAVRDLMNNRLDLLLPFLSKGAQSTRQEVAYALGQYPSRKDSLVPNLERAAGTEDDEDVLSQVRESISALREGRRAECVSR